MLFVGEVVMVCFFFNDTATTEIYTYVHTLSLHDALPSCRAQGAGARCQPRRAGTQPVGDPVSRYGCSEQAVTPAKAGVHVVDCDGFQLSLEIGRAHV